MKALTLTQPWATLVAVGAKRIETRSWSTSYRGPVAIHAAKGFPREARDFASCRGVLDLMRPHFRDDMPMLKQYPIGSVVAICRLVACKYITSAMSPGTPEEIARRSSMTPPPEPELFFGNYDTGRFAWILENVEMLPEPIPAKGALGLWEWEPPSSLAGLAKPSTSTETLSKQKGLFL